MEPTGSGQIERERERESPVLFEDSNKNIPICCIGGIHT